MSTKHPNLEVVSNNIAATNMSAARTHERRHLPRLNLSNEQFRLKQNGKIFPVADISADGMALRAIDRDDLKLFPIATHFEGTLNLHGEKHELKAHVRHLGGDLVGCEFDGLSEAARSALVRFLDPVTLGHELRPIPSPDNATLWYRGPSGTNLLLWRQADGQYHRIALFLLGSYIQWDSELGLSTGCTKPPERASEGNGIVSGIVCYDTMLLDPDSKPDLGKLNIAKTLLMSSNLPQDLKTWCVRQIESNNGS